MPVADKVRYRAVLATIRTSALARYAAGRAGTAAAVLLRLSLNPVWGLSLPFITLFPGVMLSAWLGGLGPGVLATLVSALAATYFWIAPSGSLFVSAPNDLLGLLVFATVGIVFSLLNETWRRTALTLVESEERLRVTLASIGDAVLVTDAH